MHGHFANEHTYHTAKNTPHDKNTRPNEKNALFFFTTAHCETQRTSSVYGGTAVTPVGTHSLLTYGTLFAPIFSVGSKKNRYFGHGGFLYPNV